MQPQFTRVEGADIVMKSCEVLVRVPKTPFIWRCKSRRMSQGKMPVYGLRKQLFLERPMTGVQFRSVKEGPSCSSLGTVVGLSSNRK